ncbi:MAG: MarR family winged helix-turn-helix transcriptional regulator [Deferribacterales bacterium]
MEHTEKGRILTSIILNVIRAAGQMRQDGDRMSKDLGLTNARWDVLGSLIYFDEDDMTVAKISARMGLTRQAVQRVADMMEKDGQVEYAENPYHKRAKLVKPTEEGRRLFHLVMQRQIPWANGLADGFTEEELNSALQVLSRLTEKL